MDLKTNKTKRLMWACGVIVAALLIADFFVHKHHYVKYDGIPGFFALWGAVSCAFIVFIARLLKFFVKRDEDYYDTIQPGDSDNQANLITSKKNNR